MNTLNKIKSFVQLVVLLILGLVVAIAGIILNLILIASIFMAITSPCWAPMLILAHILS